MHFLACFASPGSPRVDLCLCVSPCVALRFLSSLCFTSRRLAPRCVSLCLLVSACGTSPCVASLRFVSPDLVWHGVALLLLEPPRFASSCPPSICPPLSGVRQCRVTLGIVPFARLHLCCKALSPFALRASVAR